MQTTPKETVDFLTILRTFGLPTLAFVAIGAFFWKGLWPFLRSQIEKVTQILETQIKMSNEGRKEETTAFLRALNELQVSQREISVNLGTVATRMDKLIETVREYRESNSINKQPRKRKTR